MPREEGKLSSINGKMERLASFLAWNQLTET